MPFTLAALQIYDQYLTTYRNNKRYSRYDIHNETELKHLYSDIQLKNRYQPLYLKSPASQEILYAMQLKDDAMSLKNTISALSGDDRQTLFAQKTAYSTNPNLVQAEYIAPTTDETVYSKPVTVKVKSFACAQIDQGYFLPADESVSLPAGNYSFDILTNKLHYELQFSLYSNDTHEKVEKRIERLLNQSDIGIIAQTIYDENQNCALKLSSSAIGLPTQKKYHFAITDENTSQNNGIVAYFGLNNTLSAPQNAICEVNGRQKESYTNTFTLFNTFRITLQPQDITFSSSESSEATIGLYSDVDSIPNNINNFVNCYNDFISSFDKSLQSDMQKLIKTHKAAIEQYGIHINPDATLAFDNNHINNEWSDTGALQNFGNHILSKLDLISLDPMRYVSRKICAYSNPTTPFVNPYVTSIYSGMLCNFYC